MQIRPRRNRATEAIRQMTTETRLSPEQLICPIFVLPEPGQKIAIDSMPGIYRLGISYMLEEISACLALGIQAFILFPVVPDSLKDKRASFASKPSNFYLEAIRQAKSEFPQACIITDVAMDPYSSDGHDGLVREGKILNDESLPILAEMAQAQAEAGADIIGPSDMMDGRIGYLREALDRAGRTETGLMSYTAKYASALYGPFRDALDSAPKFGDKKTYQMNPANRREAMREAALDAAEGADYLMVKPALAYLDVIQALKAAHPLPIVAYQVSGEYSMVKAAAARGWLEEEKVIPELLLSIRRAGADLIISYFARSWAETRKI